MLAVLLQVFCFQVSAMQISDFEYSVRDSKVSPAATWKVQSKDPTKTVYTQDTGNSEVRLVTRSNAKNDIEAVLGIEKIGTSIEKLELLRFSAKDRRPESLTKCEAGECYTITKTYCEGLLQKFPQKMVKQINSCVAIEENWGSYLGQKSIQDDLANSQIKDLDLARSIDSTLKDAPLKHIQVGPNLFYLLSTLNECKYELNAGNPTGPKSRSQIRRTVN